MFYDPYSEKQALFHFLSKNKTYIAIAAAILVAAGVALASLLRMAGTGGLDPADAVDVGGYDADAMAAQQEGLPFADPALTAGSAAWDEESAPGKPGGDWRLVLVNNDRPIPDDYVIDLAILANGLQVDERIQTPLTQMLAAAEAEGLRILVASAYRTASKQADLYENKVGRLMAQGMDENQAKTEAIKEVAFPGNSEHQLGLAVDLVAAHFQLMDDRQADTAENHWLQAHCRTYGFVLRYPLGKTEATGILYEPWHFRYVGEEAAGEITDLGLCLEEYIDLLNGK